MADVDPPELLTYKATEALRRVGVVEGDVRDLRAEMGAIKEDMHRAIDASTAALQAFIQANVVQPLNARMDRQDEHLAQQDGYLQTRQDRDAQNARQWLFVVAAAVLGSAGAFAASAALHLFGL